mgnify:CR=1 FL=1
MPLGSCVALHFVSSITCAALLRAWSTASSTVLGFTPRVTHVCCVTHTLPSTLTPTITKPSAHICHQRVKKKPPSQPCKMIFKTRRAKTTQSAVQVLHQSEWGGRACSLSLSHHGSNPSPTHTHTEISSTTHLLLQQGVSKHPRPNHTIAQHNRKLCNAFQGHQLQQGEQTRRG